MDIYHYHELCLEAILYHITSLLVLRYLPFYEVTSDKVLNIDV